MRYGGGVGGHGVREGTARMYITDLSEEDIEISIKVSTDGEGTNLSSSYNT